MHYVDIDITDKKQIKKGMYVEITYKNEKNQDKHACGYIQKILTVTNNGKALKIELTNGLKGRLIGVPSKADLERETFKYYNLFLNEFHICALFERKSNTCALLSIKGKGTILLFSDNKTAKNLLKNTKYDNPNYYIRPISREQYITETYIADIYILDMKRKISRENLNKTEHQFY